MRMTYATEDESRIAFARRAADWFKRDKINRSFTDSGDILPGELLALRWGLGDDCVLVFRIGDDEPVNYQSLAMSDDELPF
jgi:hypothetical protein